MHETDIRVIDATPLFTEERAREPYKFGNAIQDRVTVCHVCVRVQDRGGRIAQGWGAISLSHFWAFPSAVVPLDAKDRAMRSLVSAFCRLLVSNPEFGHPIDLFLLAEAQLPRLCKDVSDAMSLNADITMLAALVCASPADAALHDAFGVMNEISSYDTYSAQFMSHDLGHYLGDMFRGLYLSQFVRPAAASTVPIFHSVGGLDRLTESEVGPTAPVDGLPNSLERWIERDQLFCLKVKLRGVDLPWDLDRCLSVWKIAEAALLRRKRKTMHLSLDPNEQCPDPQYMIELLRRLREKAPPAFDSLLFVEQPTERDLRRNRYDMHDLAALKPVMIDESLTDLMDIELAAELGWSGVAIKTCKCHTIALLTVVKVSKLGLPYCVQDLSNTGLAFLHSIGMTARLNPIMGVEANGRQFFPGSSGPESKIHSDVFQVRNGVAQTSSLKGPGLGYQIDCIDRPMFHEGQRK
jgi:L-alanine-DL-glutamate epimerase-like enolase superfamily enzyme